MRFKGGDIVEVLVDGDSFNIKKGELLKIVSGSPMPEDNDIEIYICEKREDNEDSFGSIVYNYEIKKWYYRNDKLNRILN